MKKIKTKFKIGDKVFSSVFRKEGVLMSNRTCMWKLDHPFKIKFSNGEIDCIEHCDKLKLVKESKNKVKKHIGVKKVKKISKAKKTKKSKK